MTGNNHSPPPQLKKTQTIDIKSPPMIHNEKDTRNNHLLQVARSMMCAARTAPKAKGVDNLEIITITGETICKLADKMNELAITLDKPFFIRDAKNIMQAEAILLLGTKMALGGLNCGYCGSATCNEKPVKTPCVFPTHDLGVAVGSAVSVAADNRVDSRVMFSVGVAAMSLGLLKECHMVIAIPLSCSGKSPFFDRPPVE